MSARDEVIGLAEEYWDRAMEAAPRTATLLGDHRFDDRVEDLSVEAESRLRRQWEGLARRLDAIDVGALDAGGRVTHALLGAELAREVDALEHRFTEMASDHMDGVHAGLLVDAAETRAPTPDSARALVERLRRVPGLLEGAAERFRAGLGAGRAPARAPVLRSMHQVAGYLAAELTADPFVTFAGPEEWEGTTAEAEWRQELSTVVRDHVRPAFRRYREVLAEELLPVARPDERPGLSWLGSDGAELYRAQVRRHTTLDDLGAEEAHQMGVDAIESLAAEYAEVGGRALGTSDLGELFSRLREDPTLRYATAEAIHADAERYLAEATAALGEWFGRLPATPCDLKVVPDYLAADMPAAYYMPPAADGSRPGAYFVNTHEPHQRTRTEAASIAFHEAVPGHHLQLAIATEQTHLPRFQRLSTGNTAFVEGWALYAERLADEMGLYRDDLERLGMLAADSWRSCRLVVDTGLHALGWSRQEAVDYMRANAPVGLDEIEVEVDRYIAIPGQALGYKVGQAEILRARRRAEQRAAAAGAPFDVRAFHDTVLGSGSISLPVLRTLV